MSLINIAKLKINLCNYISPSSKLGNIPNLVVVGSAIDSVAN